MSGKSNRWSSWSVARRDRRVRRMVLTCGVLVATATSQASVLAQCEPAQEGKVLPGDRSTWFGFSLAVYGDTAVIGSEGDDAFLFRYDGANWEKETKLLPKDWMENMSYGRSVAIYADTVVVGAYRDHRGRGGGSAYVFRHDGSNWVQEAKLLAEDRALNDGFGVSVAIHRDTAVVGATGNDDYGSGSGSSYVFRFDGASWAQEAKLLAEDGAEADRFGRSVAIHGDTVVIGAYLDDDNGRNSGSAYVFRPNGSRWVQEAKLLPDDGSPVDRFGNDVAVYGDTVLIGAQSDDDNGSSSGSAYVFRHDGSQWLQEAKLLPEDGAANDEFGRSVAIHDDTAVIGSAGDDDYGSDSGSAYVFLYDRSRWFQDAKILAGDGDENDRFGRGVAIYEDTALIGPPTDVDDGHQYGSAYLFDLSDCETCRRDPEWLCDADVDGDGQVNPVDLGLVQAAFGSTHRRDRCYYDLDCNGQINPIDAGIVQSLFGTCDPPRDVCP